MIEHNGKEVIIQIYINGETEDEVIISAINVAESDVGKIAAKKVMNNLFISICNSDDSTINCVKYNNLEKEDL